MTSDLDIYRTASVLIRERGHEADLVVAQRADSFLKDGDVDECAVWKRLLKAIKEIQREEPHEAGLAVLALACSTSVQEFRFTF